jgi:hypothetical protein
MNNALQKIEIKHSHARASPIHAHAVHLPDPRPMTSSSQQTAQPTNKYLSKYMVLTCKYFRYHTSTPLDCRLDNHALTTPTYRSVEANGTIHYHSSEWHPYYCTSYEQRNRNMMQKPPSQYLNSHLKSLFGHKGYDHWHTLSFVNEIFLKKAYRSIS